MTCIHIGGAIVCINPFFRLPLGDGRRIYMEYHNYCGPTFFKDKNATKEIEEWWEDKFICQALDWFCKRGYKA